MERTDDPMCQEDDALGVGSDQANEYQLKAFPRSLV